MDPTKDPQGIWYELNCIFISLNIYLMIIKPAANGLKKRYLFEKHPQNHKRKLWLEKILRRDAQGSEWPARQESNL